MTLAATQELESVIRELAPLREALRKRGTVMPVVGAGLSVPLKPCPDEHRLPTWKGLLEELIALVDDAQREKIVAMLAAGQQPLVASELIHHLGRPAVSTYIRERFERPRFDRPSVYDALVALPIDHFLTTNYDPFLADAWATVHDAAPNVVTPRDDGALGNLRLDARPFILMLHGTAARSKTCVLSAEEFAGLQFGTLGYSQALTSLAMQRRLLFVGHSLSDPDLSAILRECHAYAGEGAELAHWFLGVDIEDAQRRYLASHGVRAIEIATGGKFGVLETVLRELAQADVDARPIEIASDIAAPVALELPEGGPFPGLLPFDERHERFFCGREAETLDILGFLRNPPANSVRWVQIEGASGAGKSSLLRAGVIPPVRRGEVDGRRDGWRVAVIKPGQHPLRALAGGLYEALDDKSLSIDRIEDDLRKYPGRIATMLESEKRLSAGVKLVIAIDQFEEAFTFVNRDSPAEVLDRQRFGERLAEALAPECPRFYLLTTVRRDYLEHFTQLAELDLKLGNAHRVNLPQIDRDKLVASLEESTRRAGLRWDPPSLPATIGDDAFAQTGGLASLGLLLSEMWELQKRRGDATLSQRDYVALNKVAGVLALRADELLARLRTQSVQRTGDKKRKDDKTWADGALAMLVAMVRRDRDGFDRRKPITRDEAVRYAGDGATGENVLEALSGQRPRDWPGEWPLAPRLIVIRDDAALGEKKIEPLVEVSHERLSRTWATLDAAVEKETENMVWRDRLESQALAWSDTGGGLMAVDTGPTFRSYAAAGSEHPTAQRYLKKGRAKRRVFRVAKWTGGIVWLVLGLVFGLGLLAQSRTDKLNAKITDALAHLPKVCDETDPIWREWQSQLAWCSRAELEPLAKVKKWRQAKATQLAEWWDLRAEPWSSWLVLTTDMSGLPTEIAINAKELDRLMLQTPHANEIEPGAEQRAERVEQAVQALGGRDEQKRRWQRVLESLNDDTPDAYGGYELVPRYDLMPLRQRQSDKPRERVWEFLVLGTGDEPKHDGEQAPWRMEAASGVVVVLIPGGEFVMGAQSADPSAANYDELADTDEHPHAVTLSPFYLAAHEVTVGQRRRLAGIDAALDSALPVVDVAWQQAADLCLEIAGVLPTEAQWEYSCRAGTVTRYWAGDTTGDLARVGWFEDNSNELHSVGEMPANPWGLHDVHGNAVEWCAHKYGDYELGLQVDPHGPVSGSGRAIRGGSFWSVARGCRSALRSWLDPSFRGGDLGFRVALPAAQLVDLGQ